MQVRPLAAGFGAEIDDLDLGAPIAPQVAAELHRLFRTRHLLLVRGQALDVDAQRRFIAAFATLQTFRNGLCHTHISNVLGDPTGVDRLPFHSDGAFLAQPVWGLSLYGEMVDGASVPTTFVSSVHALATLPEPLRRRIEGRSAMHILDREPPEGLNRRVRIDRLDAQSPATRYHRAVHPLVRPLYADGDAALFVNEFHTSHVVDAALEDSEALLQELFAHAYAPGGVYEHAWRRHDLLVWNNVALQHGRPRSVDAAPRTLRRMVLTESP